MKKLNVTLAILVAAVMAGNAQANTVNSEPVGYVNVKIAAGTGTAKKVSYVSLPLLDKGFSITGKTLGTITGVTSTTITDSTAGWTAGALSAPATPFLIGIKSGTAAGRIFHVASSASTGGAVSGAANTATTVTISSLDTGSGITDLAAAGVAVGDSYEIYACDTLSSALGSPSTTGVTSGATAPVADSVVLVVNGSAVTYIHNGTRWSKVALGTPDASNVPLIPNYGFAYSRLGNTDINLTAIGSVPTTARKLQIKNSGVSLLAQFFPVDSTLQSIALQNTPGWVSNATAASADKVILVNSAGVAATYFYNGTGWKKVALGTPAADTTAIPAGSMIFINKLGTTSGYSTLSQALPYTL